MASEMNRRKFLGTTAAAAAHLPSFPGTSWEDRAIFRPATRSRWRTSDSRTKRSGKWETLDNPCVQLTAVCDVEKDGVNYLEWGKGEVRDQSAGSLRSRTGGKGKTGFPEAGTSAKRSSRRSTRRGEDNSRA